MVLKEGECSGVDRREEVGEGGQGGGGVQEDKLGCRERGGAQIEASHSQYQNFPH